MQKIFFTISAVFLFSVAFSQRLTQVTLSSSGSSDIITFITDDAVIVNMSKDGKILDWGIDGSKGRYYNDPGRLDKYMGRVEYFPESDKEDSRGKVKYIGRTAFTYYSSYENEILKGKLKSIGSIQIDYYGAYEDEALKGKVKNLGSTAFGYYSSFDNEAYRGKIKNIGNSSLTYYGSFDDKAFKGKIKSIGNRTFAYYSSFDRPEYRGSMKGGYQPEYLINGLKFLLR